MEIYCTIPEKKFVFIEFLPVSSQHNFGRVMNLMCFRSGLD